MTLAPSGSSRLLCCILPCLPPAIVLLTHKPSKTHLIRSSSARLPAACLSVECSIHSHCVLILVLICHRASPFSLTNPIVLVLFALVGRI